MVEKLKKNFVALVTPNFEMNKKGNSNEEDNAPNLEINYKD